MLYLRPSEAAFHRSVHERTDGQTYSFLLVTLVQNTCESSAQACTCWLAFPCGCSPWLTATERNAQLAYNNLVASHNVPRTMIGKSQTTLLVDDLKVSWHNVVKNGCAMSQVNNHLLKELLLQIQSPTPVISRSCCKMTYVCALQQHLHSHSIFAQNIGHMQ